MPRTGLTTSEIKDKAVALTQDKMRKVGFERVRLTDIAKEIGISHAALYSHFKDKTALLDAVSERWLDQIDDSLQLVCDSSKDPIDKITLWVITLHRAKMAKVQHDPELYRAYDMSANIEKPFVRHHLRTIHDQFLGLVKEAISKRRLRDADAEAMTKIILEGLIAFHHPKLVAQHLHEKREPLLKQVLESILKGLNLRS